MKASSVIPGKKLNQRLAAIRGFIITLDIAPEYTYYNAAKMKKILDEFGTSLYSADPNLYDAATSFIENYNRNSTARKEK
jgi:hypothetical protein